MRVSVVIPAYNAEACLARAIASVRGQTMRDFEIVVVDDGSADGTVALARRVAAEDPRVRLLENGTNRGVSATRNRGFDAAQGEWIAILDGDDAYAPDRLERLLAIGEAHGADMVADNLMLYDWVAGREVAPAIARRGGGADVRIVGPGEFLGNCITGRSPFDYGQLKFLFRRAFVETHRLRYPEDLRHGEDFMLYAHALLAGGRLAMTDEPLYLYTQSVGALSKTPSQMSRTLGDLDNMRGHTLALMTHPAVTAAPEFAALLSRRARAIRWFQSWERVHGPLRARDGRRVLRTALGDWRVVPLLLSAGARYLRRRLAPAMAAVGRD